MSAVAAATPSSAPTSPKASPQKKDLTPRKARDLKPPTPKKVSSVKVTKSKMPTNHPLYIDMVKTAIKENKDRKGTSRQTINKFIADKYKLGDNTVLINSGITRAIKKALDQKIISQAAGSGARGRFRIVDKDAAPKAVKKTEKKAGRPKKTEATGEKKATKAGRPKKTAEAAGEKKKATINKAGRPKKDDAAATKIPKVVDPSKPKKKAGRPPKTPKE